MLIEVALPIPSSGNFTYSVPGHFKDGIDIGKRVFVPLGKRKEIGYVVGKGKKNSDFEIKDIIDIIDEFPLFDKKRLDFFKWISEYYLTSLGTVIKFAHPLGLGKSLKKTIRITDLGSKLLNSGTITPHEKSILTAVNIEKVIEVEKLLNILDETRFEDLNLLFRRELIELDYKVVTDEKIKYEKIYFTHLDTEKISEIDSKKPAKGKILEYVRRHNNVAYSELKDIFGNISAHLKWLVAEDYLTYDEKEISRDPFKNYVIKSDIEKNLTEEQEKVFVEVQKAIKSKKFAPFLLHGVTGSGKTEIYLRAINEVITSNKQALVLVPEISLTPLLVSRFKSRFGDNVAVMHSQLSEGDRFDAWRRASRGEVGVVIGARSAIFAPLKNPGIIVVDEEHENTYKEGQNPFYNSRDLSLVLASFYKIPVILGSATPSAESFFNAVNGKYRYLKLMNRIGKSVLPSVEMVDMKNVKEKIFSPLLKNSIIENFENDNQTLLFLNRRGFNNLLVCQDCGEHLNCPNCSITLTFHKNDNSIKCHYCDLNEKFDHNCSSCGGKFIGIGIGTQKLMDEVLRIVPDANVEIMDADTIKGKTKLLKLYSRLENGQVDVLIGTQMMAKGHDLKGVTLVGVVSADQSLGIPDFRSGEKTFQLITQVAGRAGRGDSPGKVILQTYNTGHPGISYAIRHDSEGFLKKEIEIRKSLNYPPHSKLANFKITARKEENGKVLIKKIKSLAKKLCEKLPDKVFIEVVGPSESPVYKIQNKYRWQMLVRSDNTNSLNIYCTRLKEYIDNIKGNNKIVVDIDPYNFM